MGFLPIHLSVFSDFLFAGGSSDISLLLVLAFSGLPLRLPLDQVELAVPASEIFSYALSKQQKLLQKLPLQHSQDGLCLCLHRHFLHFLFVFLFFVAGAPELLALALLLLLEVLQQRAVLPLPLQLLLLPPELRHGEGELGPLAEPNWHEGQQKRRLNVVC